MTLIVLGFTLAASTEAGTIRHDRDPQAYIDFANRPEYQAVGLIDVTYLQPGAIGSGSLVAPNWVLTAAHVIEGATNISFQINGQSHSAIRWVSHPKYNGDLHRGYDLALVELAAPVNGVTPAKLYRKSNEFSAVGAFLGFGKSGDGLTGETIDDRMKRGGTNLIDGSVKSNKFGQPEYLSKLPKKSLTFAVDFDNPKTVTDSILGAPFPTDLESLIAPGDSGGPVFLTDPKSGESLLAGIHSFGEIPDGTDNSDYGDVTGHTRVSKFTPWIDGVIEQRRKYRRLNYSAPITVPSTGLPRSLLLEDEAGVVPEPGAALLLLLGVPFALRRRAGTARRAW